MSAADFASPVTESRAHPSDYEQQLMVEFHFSQPEARLAAQMIQRGEIVLKREKRQ